MEGVYYISSFFLIPRGSLAMRCASLGFCITRIPQELIKSNRDSVRKVREIYVIDKGKTLGPLGMNKKDAWNVIHFFHLYLFTLFVHFKFLLYDGFNVIPSTFTFSVIMVSFNFARYPSFLIETSELDLVISDCKINLVFLSVVLSFYRTIEMMFGDWKLETRDMAQTGSRISKREHLSYISFSLFPRPRTNKNALAVGTLLKSILAFKTP